MRLNFEDNCPNAWEMIPNEIGDRFFNGKAPFKSLMKPSIEVVPKEEATKEIKKEKKLTDETKSFFIKVLRGPKQNDFLQSDQCWKMFCDFAEKPQNFCENDFIQFFEMLFREDVRPFTVSAYLAKLESIFDQIVVTESCWN